MSAINVRTASWVDDRLMIEALRYTVFVIEQMIPAGLEVDQHDAGSFHALACTKEGRGIATGRMLPDGRLGRIAVLREYRNQGVGQQMTHYLIEQAIATGLNEVYLHAQLHALGYYQRLGFVAEGKPFQEAGIKHQLMRKVV